MRKNNALCIIKGMSITIISAIILSCICSYAILQNILPHHMNELIAAVITAAAMYIGCVAGIGSSKNRTIVSLTVAGISLAIMILCKFAFFPGDYRQIAYNLVAIIISVFAIALTGKHKKHNRDRSPRKRKR